MINVSVDGRAIPGAGRERSRRSSPSHVASVPMRDDRCSCGTAAYGILRIHPFPFPSENGTNLEGASMHGQSTASTDVPAAPIREAVHDLRNLFGIIASARHLLDGDMTAVQRSHLLDAIENSAKRGGELATGLLASSVRRLRLVDVDEQLTRLTPMMRGLVGGPVDFVCDFQSRHAFVTVEPLAFDAAMIELVTNARKALGLTGRITVRTRRSHKRIWLTVADNGCGMTKYQRGIALRGSRHEPGAHGTGLGSLRQFVQDSGGHLHVRSREGRGTVICLVLPLVLLTRMSAPGAPSPQIEMEIQHADRQPIAA